MPHQRRDPLQANAGVGQILAERMPEHMRAGVFLSSENRAI
jgi:hypothetical protein